MNPQAPKNINNGRSMDVMPGSNRDQTSNQPPQPPTNTMAPADGIAQASETPQMSGPAKKSRRLTPKMIVIIVVIIGVILAGLLGALLYMRSDSNQAEEEQQLATTTQPEDSESGRVTTTEIDQTIEDIDKTLNTLDDSGDFTPNDLSDSSLGL